MLAAAPAKPLRTPRPLLTEVWMKLTAALSCSVRRAGPAAGRGGVRLRGAEGEGGDDHRHRAQRAVHPGHTSHLSSWEAWRRSSPFRLVHHDETETGWG